MQAVLIALSEAPDPDSDPVDRKVLISILGTRAINFDKAIIDIASNPHLSVLNRLGVFPIVCETKERSSTNARTVLDRSRPLDRRPFWSF